MYGVVVAGDVNSIANTICGCLPPLCGGHACMHSRVGGSIQEGGLPRYLSAE